MSITKEQSVKQLARLERVNLKDFDSAPYSKEVKENIRPKIVQILKIVREMSVVLKEPSIYPPNFDNIIEKYIEHFLGFWSEIITFDPVKNPGQGYRNHINGFTNWYNKIFEEPSGATPNNFLTHYNTLRWQMAPSFDKLTIEMSDIALQSRKYKKEIQVILDEIKQKAGEESIANYAEIFRKQAIMHSSFFRKEKWIGKAQIWFIAGLIFGVGMVFVISKLDDIIPLTDGKKTINIIQYLTRLAIISFMVFLVTFSFKQFSINSHLATLNRHRQNTLDSYKLFMASIDASDSTTRHALMMEVAKAIYESGSTGYISGKRDDSGSSIIEMTKFLGVQK